MILLALMLAATPLPPQPPEVEVTRDPITDRIRASATLRQAGERLVVSCAPHDDDGPRVSFHSRRWLARGHFISGDRKITYRFDNHQPRRMLWDIEDRRAALTHDQRVAHFLGYLRGSRRLVIRARDVEKRRFHATFDLTGAATAVDQVLRVCAAGRART